MKSRLMWTIVGIAVSFLVLATFVAIQLDHLFGSSETELSRVNSPGLNLDAVVTRIDGNATVSSIYVVDIRNAGARRRGTRVLNIDRAMPRNGISLRWIGNSLHIQLPIHRETQLQLDSIMIDGKRLEIEYGEVTQTPDLTSDSYVIGLSTPRP